MKKILVIDDEDDLRAMIVKALEREGFETIEADNGSTALTLAKTHQPDLIISDVIMDSGSGFMLQELLRADDWSGKTCGSLGIGSRSWISCKAIRCLGTPCRRRPETHSEALSLAFNLLPSN
jgi:PleD family two-component response regulator